MQESIDDLFADPGSPMSKSDSGIWFVTNRFNLLEILSSRLIYPVQGYGKWYHDLLGLAEGWIPLVRGPIGDDLCNEVSDESSAAFPVALEIDPSKLDPTELPALDNGAMTRSPLMSGCQAYATSGVIPLAAIRRICFRTADELAEHRVRDYENVPNRDPELVVSAPTFGEGGLPLGDLVSFVSELGAAEANLRSPLASADRASGAMTMLAVALPPRLEHLRSLRALLESKTSRSGIPSWIASPILGRTVKNPSAEELLFSSAFKVLSETDRNHSWRPADIVVEVERRVSEFGKTAAIAEVLRNTATITSIIKNMRPLKRFKPGSGLDSAKALTLALLRPDPASLLRWSRRETGASADVAMAAAALTGALQGRARLSVDLRPPGIDEFLAEQIAAQIAAEVEDAVALPQSGKLSVREHENPDGTLELTLRCGSDDIFAMRKTVPSLQELLERADIGFESDLELMETLAQRMGWPQCRHVVLIGDAGSITTSEIDGKLLVEFVGWPTIQKEIDLDKLIKLVTSHEIPKDLEVMIRDHLDRP